MYLIGPNRYTCVLRGEIPLVRVGGGYEKLEDFLLKNDYVFTATLEQMIRSSGQNIEWVVKELMKGKKIR